MRYAICYVSSANNLSQEEVKNLLENSTKKNNANGITGILLYSEDSFFQLIEGEIQQIKELFSTIEKDPRHHSVIKFIEKSVLKPAYDGYIHDVITDEHRIDDSKLKEYFNHVDVLNLEAKNAAKRVMETILM